MGQDDLLTAGEVARLIDRSARTVSRLAKNGDLPYAHRTTAANGVYLFRRADVITYLNRETDKAATA